MLHTRLITSDIVLPHEVAPPFHTSTIVSSFTLSLLSKTSCHTETKIAGQLKKNVLPGPLTNITVLCRVGLDNVQHLVNELRF